MAPRSHALLVIEETTMKRAALLLALALGLFACDIRVLNGRSAFVWADQPTSASYTPVSDYQWNSTGAANTIRRTSTGSYQVTLPGMVDPDGGGNVQVSAYGQFGGRPSYCNVMGWMPESQEDLQVAVSCFDFETGTPSDAYFTARFVDLSHPWADPVAEVSYLWSDRASPALDVPREPDRTYQFTPSDEPITVTRVATGDYEVEFPNPTGREFVGVAQVTPYGSNTHCTNGNVRAGRFSPNSTDVWLQVWCYDAAGESADSRFTVTLSWKTPSIPGLEGAVFSHEDHGGNWTSSGLPLEELPTQIENGRYMVRLPGVGAAPEARSSVLVTGYGSFCTVDGWMTWDADAFVYVTCRFLGGFPAGWHFRLEYLVTATQ